MKKICCHQERYYIHDNSFHWAKMTCPPSISKGENSILPIKLFSYANCRARNLVTLKLSFNKQVFWGNLF